VLHGSTENEKPQWFKKEQKKRWKRRGITNVSGSALRRAWTFQAARLAYESEQAKSGRAGSRRAGLPWVKLEAMAMKIAADINRMIPEERLKCEAIQANWNQRADLLEQDTAP